MSLGVPNLGGPQGFWVYILASGRNGTIYTGHTDNLHQRLHQHRTGQLSGFASQHGCGILVWAEWHETRDSPFGRERAIKNWRRSWKLRLIEDENPTWRDRSDDYRS